MAEESIEKRLERLEKLYAQARKGVTAEQALKSATRDFLETRDIAAAHRLLDQLDSARLVAAEEDSTITITITITITVTV
jgi:hypothetical protein